MSEAENFVYSVEQVRLTETNFLLDRPGSESLMKKPDGLRSEMDSAVLAQRPHNNDLLWFG